MLPIIEPTVSQLYIIELESPPEIDELIIIVYNTSVDPLLYQFIAVKTASVYMLPTIEPTVSQLYIIELELPPEINKLITIVYNTSIDLLLY